MASILKKLGKTQARLFRKKIYAFLRKNGKKGSEPNTSIYTLVVNALKNDGVDIYEGDRSAAKDRNFLVDNMHLISEKTAINSSVLVVVNKQKKQHVSKKTNQHNLDLEFVKTKEFLSTYEWRKLRMEAIKKYGRKCACCGASGDGVVINIDHIKPRKKYPELALDINNLQPLCDACNHGKGNWDETNWRELNAAR